MTIQNGYKMNIQDCTFLQNRYKMYVIMYKMFFCEMQLLIQNKYIKYKMAQFCMSLVHVLCIQFGNSLHLFLHK